MDMFPQTTKQRKRLWICSHVRKISKDIQPILSSQWILRNISPQPPQIIIFEKLCALLKIWVFPFRRCRRYGDGQGTTLPFVEWTRCSNLLCSRLLSEHPSSTRLLSAWQFPPCRSVDGYFHPHSTNGRKQKCHHKSLLSRPLTAGVCKIKTPASYQSWRPYMAEKERFELSRRFPDLHP